MKNEYIRSLLLTLVSIIIWSASFVATKFAYTAFTPLLLCFIRFFLAAIVLWTIRIITHRNTPLPKQDRKAVILSALSGISIYYAFENIGLSLTSAANASVITAVYPIFTVILGVVVFHDKIPLRTILGILIGVAGILIVVWTNGEGQSSLTGIALLLVNGFMWGFYNYEVQKVSEETDSFTLTCYQTLFGTLFLTPVLLLEYPFTIGAIDGKVIASVLFLSLFCSILAYFIYNEGLRGIPAAAAASLLNLMPVFGLFFSAVLLHETITPQQILGTIAVIAGVMVSTIRK